MAEHRRSGAPAGRRRHGEAGRRARRALLALLVPTATSASVGLPTGVCEAGDCARTQRGIWGRFQRASGPRFERGATVYSGSCYHGAHGFDPRIAHAGAVLVDETEAGLTFAARFSFFERNSPFDRLDVSAARRRLVAGGDIHPLEPRASYAAVESPPESFAPFRYWLRQEGGAGRLLLVGYFGFTHTILCDLRPH